MKRAAWWGLCGVVFLAGCQDIALPGVNRPGRFNVVFQWDSQRPTAEEVLWVVGRVTETTSGAPRELSTAGPERYQPGMELRFSAVDRCDACVVAVEFREGQGSQAPEKYYGISNAFALHPNDNVTVTVRVALRGVPDPSGLSLEVVGPSGQPTTRVNTSVVDVVARRQAGGTATVAGVSNLPSFPEDAQGATPRRSAEAPFTGDGAAFAAWDLLGGRAGACGASGDCALRLYGRLRDAEGYPSQSVFTDVVWDRTPPAVQQQDGGLAASVRPAQPAGPELVSVQFTTNEPCRDIAALELPDVPALQFVLAGLRQDPFNTTYSFVALSPADVILDVVPHTLRATFTDVAGNTTQADVGTVQRDPNALALVGTLPAVTALNAAGGVLPRDSSGPWFLTANDQVVLDITFNRPLAGVPAVRFGARDPFVGGGFTCDATPRCRGTFVVVTEDPDGELRISVVASDQSERPPVTFELSRDITVDQTPPLVEFLWSATLVRPGQDVVLTALANEPVDWTGGAVPQLQHGVAPPLLLVAEDGAPVGVQRRWRARFVESAGSLFTLDGAWALSVTQAAWQDRARNAPVVNLPPDVVVDSVPPVVSQVRVTPDRLGVGDALDVVVTAEVGATLDGGVALEGAAEVRVEVAGVGGLCAPEAGTTWRCVVTVPDNLPDDNYAVTVQALDQAGNVGTDGTSLPVDRTHPGVSYADLFYVPGAGNPLVQVTAAKSGTRVTVVLATSELVTQMRLYATRLGTPDVLFDGPPVMPSNANPTAVGFFTLDVSPTLASGTYALRVELVDRSGNANLGGEVLPTLEVRNHTPVLLFAQDTVALVRQPVGGPVTLYGVQAAVGGSSSSSGGLTSSSQPIIMPGSSGLPTGTEGGNVQADAQGPAATAPARYALLHSTGLAGTRAAPAVAALQLTAPLGGFVASPPRVLRVLAWPDNGGGAGAVLRELPWALASGAPTQADVTWDQAPGRGVLLVGVDEAGNLSLPVPVMHTEVDIKPIEPANAVNRSTLVVTNMPAAHPLDLQARDLGLKDVFGAYEAAVVDGERLQRRLTRHFTHIPPALPVPGGEDWSGAYDPARDRWVVLTTKGNGTTGLFEWDGLAWEERLLPIGAPNVWLGAAAAYHPLLGGVVFVGGCGSRNQDATLSGAWVWDGVTLRREGELVPAARAYAAAVYDPQRGALLVLGGSSTCGAASPRPINDVWNHDGAGWVDLGSGTGLSPRIKAAAVYVPGRGVVVVGGQAPGVQWLNGSNTFETLSPGGTSPLPRAGHALVALPGGDVCLAGGGTDETPQGTLWCFNAVTVGNWRQHVVLPPLVGQPPLLAVDVHRDSRLLVLIARQTADGGQTFALPTPTGPARQVTSVGMVAAPGASWMTRGLPPAHPIHLLVPSLTTVSRAEVRTWTGTTWSSAEDPGTIPLAGAAFFTLPGGAVGFHGGVVDVGAGGISADFVGRGVNGQLGWKSTALQGSPALAYHAAAYHEGDEVTVLFGGMDTAITVSQDTFHVVTTLGTSSFQTPSLLSAPPGRFAAAMAYGNAPGLDHVVLYGGATFVDTAPLSDVWMYSPSGGWAPVAVQGVPQRQNHAMAFEEGTGCFVIVGGETTANASGGDQFGLTAAPLARLCWTAGGMTYSEPAVRGEEPSTGNHMAAAFDAVNQATVVVGGDGTPAVEGTWLLRTPPGPPAYTFVGDVSDARLAPTHALEVRVMAQSSVDGGTPTGWLHVWNTGADAGVGRWVAAESSGGDGDVTLPARDTVWRGNAGAVVGAQVRGIIPSEKVVLDAVEIRVRYCQRADGGVCSPGAGP